MRNVRCATLVLNTPVSMKGTQEKLEKIYRKARTQMEDSSEDATRRKRANEWLTKVENLQPSVEHISHETFMSLTSGTHTTLLLDVREEEERQTSTIQDARGMPLVSRLDQEMRDGQWTRIVTFCTVGMRSGMAAKRLQDAGHTVYNYSLLRHLWGGGALVDGRGDGSIWDGRVHMFHARYCDIIPSHLDTEVFSTAIAAWRAIFMLPALVSTLTWRNPWRSVERIPAKSEEVEPEAVGPGVVGPGAVGPGAVGPYQSGHTSGLS